MFDPKEVARINEETQRWESTTLKQTLDRFPERQAEFVTTSSAPVNRLYTPADVAGMDYVRDHRLPRRVSVHARRARHHAPRQAVDDAHVRRLWHGRGDQRPLPLSARAGPDRPERRL